MHSSLKTTFFDLLPSVHFASMRWEHHDWQELSIRTNELLPVRSRQDSGVMITIFDKGGMGYGSTSDLSEKGIKNAIDQAYRWASLSRDKFIFDSTQLKMPKEISTYQSNVKQAWRSVDLKTKLDYLRSVYDGVTDPDVVDCQASLWHHRLQKTVIATNQSEQISDYELMLPQLSVTVAKGSESQTRTFGGHAYTQQGGFERFAELGFTPDMAQTVADEARELLAAPNCPEESMDVLVAPDQMVLQIHESIGHPLELDRILGDERNFAGTSFVSLDMFGKFQYGSHLLNITYDPTIDTQVASYPVDDDGLRAQKTHVIKDGLLVRPLGGGISQQRAGGISGVANSRSTHWNRPPIDRMANLNLEPGDASLDQLIGQVDRGIYVKTNCSWSIDDSRNKFQFGCEWARLIENGELTNVVKNPGYRGISASFWRSLKAVGDRSTFEIMGTPNCGKGEPNQAIHVGHASPACLFADVQVFGGGSLGRARLFLYVSR